MVAAHRPNRYKILMSLMRPCSCTAMGCVDGIAEPVEPGT
jgi:hypothetical protein